MNPWLVNIVLPISNLKLPMLILDRFNNEIGGNKYFKLKHNLLQAKTENKSTLLTFGGAFSNHIASTAIAGKIYNFKTIGFIRGDELNPNSNATLKQAYENGMQLNFISREEYQKRNDTDYIQKLQLKFHDSFIIPEGGTNHAAIQGTSEIVNLIDIPFDVIICPVGTGGTLAGLALSLKDEQKAIGFSVLKSYENHEKEIQSLLSAFHSHKNNWEINREFHFEGYGKVNEELASYKLLFESLNDIELDFIYNTKTIFGLDQLIVKNKLNKDKRIIIINTGGIQGNSGFNIKHSLVT